jgi:hypothetical protein
MPGPLSWIETRKRVSATCLIATRMSGRMLASSQASSELSTPSFTVVSSAFDGLSNPSRWRFLAKNSDTEMSRCFLARSSAVAGVRERLEAFATLDFAGVALRGAFLLGAFLRRVLVFGFFTRRSNANDC